MRREKVLSYLATTFIGLAMVCAMIVLLVETYNYLFKG